MFEHKYKTTIDFNIKNTILYFIHIPKTSGSALSSKQIRKLGHGFNVPNSYRTPKNKKGCDGYITDTWEVYKYPNPKNYKITIIRNPFDLLCSYYFHGEQLKNNNEYCHSGWACCNYTHQFKTFKEFIHAYCDNEFEWHQPCFKNFLYSQLFDINHNCVANIIVKYEHLNDAINTLNKKLNHPIKKNNHANKSNLKTKNYREYYDKEMIGLVNKKCIKELQYFNYDFNGSTKKEPLIINSNLKYDVINNKFIE
jgi:hypothetical protein